MKLLAVNLPRLSALFVCSLALPLLAQEPADSPPPPPEGRRPVAENPPPPPPPPFDGPQRGGPRGFGGPGGPMMQETKLVKQFDKDGDKRLNAEERKAAREFLAKEKAAGRGPGGPGGPRGPGGPGGFRGPGGPGGGAMAQEPPQPGRKLSPADVKSFPDAPVYDIQALRTFFLEFENADWEKELADFNNTDVEAPAKLTVDGKTYHDVGVHFRGMSSFMMVPEGRKRSLNLSLDDVHEDQQLGGCRTFNLLNSMGDPTYLRAVLYNQIAREYQLPAPKANYVRVVINGESWGVYVNAQQFNKDFVNDWWKTTKGARWHVPGSPGGRGSLKYLGEDAAAYKEIYQIKSKDDPESWASLIRLCKALTETPPEALEKELAPLLDIDGALKFLALEIALINTDGYWVRTSDYNLYQEKGGRFHVIPHDVNESFRAPEGGGGPGGFGGGRGPRGGGWGRPRPGEDAPPDAQNSPGNPPPPAPEGNAGAPRGPGGEGRSPEAANLDPLVNATDANKPLLSKLLAVPELRARYLSYVHDIAEKWLDWEKLGPLAQQYQAVIAEEVKADTRKLDSFEAFGNGVAGGGDEQPGQRGPRGPMSLKRFADERRAFLLNHPQVKGAAPLQSGGGK